MLKSMTGFGAGRAAVGGEELSVELRSVNHKFCEVKVRMPRELSALEGVVTKQVKDRLTRGAVDVSVKRSLRLANGLVPTVDLAMAREYRRAFSEVAKALGLVDEVSVREIAQQPNVIRLEETQVNLEDAGRAMEQAVTQALTALSAMRDREGQALETDLTTRIDGIARVVAELEKLCPQSVDEYRVHLAQRISELSKGLPIDPQRLAQEVAFFAERTDVAEELTRLASHLDQFRALMASKEPSGRKMDFLVQEMHREVNTTGSKSQHSAISGHVVGLKAELERIREQVQNIE